eukprot:6477626-Amphidinium_carterae.1
MVATKSRTQVKTKTESSRGHDTPRSRGQSSLGGGGGGDRGGGRRGGGPEDNDDDDDDKRKKKRDTKHDLSSSSSSSDDKKKKKKKKKDKHTRELRQLREEIEKLRREREPVTERRSFYIAESPAAPAAQGHATASGSRTRRLTRIHIYEGNRPLPPGPEGIDPQANICLADDFVELLEQSASEEDAIVAFLELPLDNAVLEGMREAFVEYIGTSAKLFVLKVYEWRKIFDMSEADYRELLASTASAFPSAMTAENKRSKEEILRAAKSKSAAKPATKPTSGSKEHRDRGDEEGDPPEDRWAAWREKHGMSNLPPKKQEKADDPDVPGDRASDRGSERKKKERSKKERSPSPSGSDDDPSDDDSSSDESSSSSRRKRKKKKKSKIEDCDDVKIDNLPHMGKFDEWVYEQRQKMMTACKANHDHTLRFVVSVEDAAREELPCPDVPRKFRRLSLMLGVSIEKITRKSDLGVKLSVMRRTEQQRGRTLSGFYALHTICC